MIGNDTEPANVPLSRYTNEELRAGAAEFRRMAATASTAAGMKALKDLGVHFDAVARQRETEEYEAYNAAVAFALRLTSVPSPQALQMAADLLCTHSAVSGARQHPMIQNAALELAYLLTAYDLVPAEQQSRGGQFCLPERSDQAANHGVEPPDRHILVVDDAADVLVTVGAFLMNAGFAVQKAANGDEALSVIVNDPRIDVLVTDFAMPGLSGVELIMQALQVRPTLKSLVITGYPNADGLAELPPNTTILVKPFRRASLVTTVKSLLEEAKPTAEQTLTLTEEEKAGLVSRILSIP